MATGFGMGYGGQGYGQPGPGGMGYGQMGYGMGPGTFCPTCGYPMPSQTMGMTPWAGYPQFMGGMMPWMGTFPFVGGMMPWMGGYPGYGFGPYYQTTTIPDDDQIREMIYDSLDADPIIPYDADISVDVTGGLVTLTGTVPNKRIKHAAGDDAWWVPGVWDINNQLQIAGRAPTRAERPQAGARPSTTAARTQRPKKPTT